MKVVGDADQIRFQMNACYRISIRIHSMGTASMIFMIAFAFITTTAAATALRNRNLYSANGTKYICTF
jgi:hypothetical protein